MRPKIRKVDSNKRKKDRKAAKQQLEKQAAAFLNHPKECCVCKSPFERNKETVKSWHVVVREERVRLTCPDCWSTIQEGLERVQDD